MADSRPSEYDRYDLRPVDPRDNRVLGGDTPRGWRFINLAENQPQYATLPAILDETSDEAVMLTCWRLSVWQRLALLFTGKIWLWTFTFGEDFQPVALTTKEPFGVVKGSDAA